MTTKYCDDPDHCTYSDCPTALCDRNKSSRAFQGVVMPPPGYVMLVEGQKIKAGDLYCRGVGHSWHETRIKAGYWTEHGNYPMCRKLTPST